MIAALIGLLLADSGVQAAVGTRVWPVERPQASSLPAITLQTISGRRGYHMIGADDLVQSRVQLAAWGLSYLHAKTAAPAAISALSGFSGTHSGTVFGGIFVDSEDDEFEDGSNAQNGQPERHYRVRVDFLIWHNGV
ncbi:hypothetical protein ATO13_23206 [Stappia sp. 22II-S9-Z10]|nr:hypothetical protein ATO13_23206 [Stappia sp. 22II-S9-Z10]